MATKNKPGKFDCYEAAHSDEPMFVLLGRDPAASILVELWVRIRRELGCEEPEKLAEAEACVKSLAQWACDLGKTEKIKAANEAAFRIVHRIVTGESK